MSQFESAVDVLSAIGVPIAAAVMLACWIRRHGAWVRRPGDATSVYRLFDASGSLLYVGISVDLERRFRQHALDKAWWPNVARADVRQYRSRLRAARAEHRAIMRESPRHNILRLGRAEHLRSARAR